MRIQDEERLATSLGYTCEPDPNRGHGWSRFFKNNRVVLESPRQWATADLIDGHYSNHEYFPDLEQALKRQITN